VCANKTGSTVTVRPDDAVARKPYDPHTARAELEAEYPGELASSTVPAANKPNTRLRGQRHPRSGVVFDRRGLPIYDDVAVFDTRIPPEAVAATSRRSHFQAATKQLDEAIRGGQINASRFTEDQLAAISKHQSEIPEYTGHHHQDRGRMQLVPQSLHKDTGHVGGYVLWNK
jgi:filamentous hemagglutinin